MLKRLNLTTATLLIVPLLACTGVTSASARADTRTQAVPSAAARTAPPIVVAISIDGLNPSAIVRLGAAGTPHLHRMMREGSWTFNARAAVRSTDTLPNHTGMMTGRPIAGRQGHHVTFNQDRRRLWLAKVAGAYRPSMFDVAHDRGLTTSLYTSKSKFDFLNRSWNARYGARDRVGANNGRDKIDWYIRTSPDDAMNRLVHQLVRGPAKMNFWHISVPDSAGHRHGFMSAGYLRAVTHSDWLVGKLLNALDRRPALKKRVSIVLTSDHGGHGAHHRDPLRLASYRVPFMTWGRGVTAGRSLYSLNPDRKDPRRARVGYSGPQPVRNTDLANLAASFVGVPDVFTVANRKTLKVR